MRQFVFALVAALGASVFGDAKFDLAEPIWVKGETETLNSFFAFVAEIKASDGDELLLRVTAGYDYRATWNGEFAGFGPVRTAPGFFRIDEWRLNAKSGVNRLVIDSAGYNCNNFYLPKQMPFVQAEILKNGKVIAATGKSGFEAYGTARLRKVPRYSYQRVFSEIYRYPYDCGAKLEVEKQEPKHLLPREWAYPTFEVKQMKAVSFEKTVYDANAKVEVPRFIDKGPDNFIHFAPSELEENQYFDMQRTKTVSRSDAPSAKNGWFGLRDHEGIVFAAERIFGGFHGLSVKATGPVTIYLTHDEVLADDGSVSIMRADTLATSVWHFDKAGEYTVETFEPYGFKYARVLAVGENVEITAPFIRTYESPLADRAGFRASDPALAKIFEAARGSYKANAVDCFNDCPDRERGGWIGDTFFTGRASQWLTGSGRNERLFLENFFLPESFGESKRYSGFVPAVWPCDLMCRECFIPTYDMWMIMELGELVERNGYHDFAERCRPRVMGIMAALERSLNDDGLLQHLPGWVFVEWSRANMLPYDVNYPSNMMYARTLDAVAKMYSLPEYAERAEAIRARVRRYSDMGEWFCDNSVVVDECGTLGLSGERTEVCQYYAFFTGTATPESHPKLYNRLMNEFGPNRIKEGKYPEIYAANFLFGTCLRMELLSQAGRSRQMLQEVRDYFLYMAERTGTLWENQNTAASCCHGFASIASEYLFRDVLGVRNIDRSAKTIKFAPPADLDLEWCEGDVPLNESEIAHLRWEKSSDGCKKTVVLPEGWKLANN